MNIPISKQGWLSKRSRGASFASNWKRRYFFLIKGVLIYYDNCNSVLDDEFDIATTSTSGLKGSMNLDYATIRENKGDANRKRFAIETQKTKNDEKDMTLEADSSDEADSWIVAIQQHIDYANFIKNQGVRMFYGDRSSLNPASSMSMLSSSPSLTGGVFGMSNPSDLTVFSESGQSSSLAGAVIVPNPWFVMKVIRNLSREKVFINICFHENVELKLSLKDTSKWPFTLSGQCREVKESKLSSEADEGPSVTSEAAAADVTYYVYDFIVNAEIPAMANKEKKISDLVCNKALSHLKKHYNEDVDQDYKIPKIKNKYKGDIHKFKFPAKGNIGESIPPPPPTSPIALQTTPKAAVKSSNRESLKMLAKATGAKFKPNNNTDDSEAALLASRSSVTSPPLRKIPYTVQRAIGVIAKEDLNGTSGKVIACGQHVVGIGRVRLSDQSYMLHSSAGYIPECVLSEDRAKDRVELSKRAVVPTLPHYPPVSFRIVTTRFVPCEEREDHHHSGHGGGSGGGLWPFSGKKKQQQRQHVAFQFFIEISYKGNLYLKIRRDLEQLLQLYRRLAKLHSKHDLRGPGQANPFVVRFSDTSKYWRIEENKEVLLTNVEVLLKLIENIEEYLCSWIRHRAVMASRLFVEFMTPTQEDVELMDVDLLASDRATLSREEMMALEEEEIM